MTRPVTFQPVMIDALDHMLECLDKYNNVSSVDAGELEDVARQLNESVELAFDVIRAEEHG